MSYLFFSIVSGALAIFLYNRAEWQEAERSTKFGLTKVKSELDLLAYRAKQETYRFGAKILAIISVFLMIAFLVGI